jgi:hypothetical protein
MGSKLDPTTHDMTDLRNSEVPRSEEDRHPLNHTYSLSSFYFS